MMIDDWSGDNLKKMGASCGGALNKVFGQERVGSYWTSLIVRGLKLEGWGRQSSQGQENDKIPLR
jgi:hypothetical protein